MILILPGFFSSFFSDLKLHLTILQNRAMVPPSSFAFVLLLCSLTMPHPGTRAAEFLSRYNSDSSPGPFPDLNSGKSDRHSRPASDDDKHVEIYSNIIDMLGQLNVLTPHGRSCYVLHKIERIVNNSVGGGGGEGRLGDGNSSIVEVRLFFTESVLTGSVTTAKEGDAMGDGNGNSGGTGSEANDDTGNGDDELANRTRAECKKKQAYALWAGALTSGGEKGNAVNGSGSISAPSTKIEDDSGKLIYNRERERYNIYIYIYIYMHISIPNESWLKSS